LSDLAFSLSSFSCFFLAFSLANELFESLELDEELLLLEFDSETSDILYFVFAKIFAEFPVFEG
jgi:hypothetical protein